MVVLTIIPYYNLISSGEGKKRGTNLPYGQVFMALYQNSDLSIPFQDVQGHHSPYPLPLNPLSADQQPQAVLLLLIYHFTCVLSCSLCAPPLLSCKWVTDKIVQASPCFSWVSCFVCVFCVSDLQPILRELNEYCPIFGMGGLLPHSYPRLIAMIIGANCLWLVYLWMQAAVSVFSSYQNSFCFREAPCLLWPSMDCLFSLFIVERKHASVQLFNLMSKFTYVHIRILFLCLLGFYLLPALLAAFQH